MTFTLTVTRRVDGTLDRHNNPTVAWSDPVDWRVRALAPGSADAEPNQPNRDAVVVAWTVYSDASEDVPGERDRVTVMGEEFEVVGRPADWTRGPWHHPTAGVVTELQRWEG